MDINVESWLLFILLVLNVFDTVIYDDMFPGGGDYTFFNEVISLLWFLFLWPFSLLILLVLFVPIISYRSDDAELIESESSLS